MWCFVAEVHQTVVGKTECHTLIVSTRDGVADCTERHARLAAAVLASRLADHDLSASERLSSAHSFPEVLLLRQEELVRMEPPAVPECVMAALRTMSYSAALD